MTGYESEVGEIEDLFSASVLERALRIAVGGERRGRVGFVREILHRDERIAPTLLSLWRRDGTPLDPAMTYELKLHEDRQARYEQLAVELLSRHPGLTQLKGRHLTALYPPEIVRQMSDIDLVGTSTKSILAAVEDLADVGFEVVGFSIQKRSGDLHILLGLERSATAPYDYPDRVEMSTALTFGDLPFASRSESDFGDRGTLRSLLLVLEERRQHRYRVRDLLDAAVLLRSLAHEQPLAELERAARCAQLGAEYHELRAELHRVGFANAPPPRKVLDRARDMLARAAGLIEIARHPVASSATIAPAHLSGRFAPGAAWLLRTISHRYGLERLFAAGVPLFGIRIESASDRRDIAVRFRDARAWADTPFGLWAMTLGIADADALEADSEGAQLLRNTREKVQA